MKKTILLFGDSNTWGFRPDNDGTPLSQRWDDDARWGGVLQSRLGDEYKIIVDGQCGRTTVWDDPIEENRCGKHQLIPSMMAHSPLTALVLLLGTNDLKARFSLTAEDVAAGASLLVQMAHSQPLLFTGGTPRILLVCPPPLAVAPAASFAQLFTGGRETSLQLPPYFEAAAQMFGAAYLNAGAHIHTSERDGVHLEADQHALLGQAVAAALQGLLP